MAAQHENVSDEVPEEDGPVKAKKAVRLSLHLIVKRHLVSEASSWSHDKIIEELNKIKRVRLDREDICEIDSMELLSSDVTNLYLQSNMIRHIQNLECLPNLQVLVLSNNQISEIEGISHLERLVLLDLSENQIHDVMAAQLPSSLVILNLKGNPCASKSSHRKNLIQTLPKLKQLDGEDTSKVDDDFEDTEEEDEEEEEADVEEGVMEDVSVDPLASLGKPLLPDIKSNLQDITTEMLMRSQSRLEGMIQEHKRHVQEITNMKIKSKIQPLGGISTPP